MKISNHSLKKWLPVKTLSTICTKVLMAFMALLRFRKQPSLTPPSNLYRQCHQTPLDIFIDCLVNKNLKRLIRYGSAPDYLLNEAWENLFTEYCELLGSPQYLRMVALTKEIGQLQSKMLVINLCVRVLSFRYSYKCVQQLHRFGYTYKFPVNNFEQYKKDLETVIKKSKASELALDQALLQYKKLFEGIDGKTPSYEIFEKNLIELSKFMGFRVNPKEVTVSEYVAMIKRREREIQQLLSKKPTNKHAHSYND